MKLSHKSGVFFLHFLYVLIVSGLFFSFIGCSNSSSDGNVNPSEPGLTNVSGLETSPAFMKYSIFQNSDSTWGFAIIINSRPYLLTRQIPGHKDVRGFQSPQDAEKVAKLFLEMIRAGNPDPKLNRKMIDSLNL